MFKYTLFKTDNAIYFYDGVTSNFLEIDEYFYVNHKPIIDAVEQRENVEINDVQLRTHVEEMISCIEEGDLAEISDAGTSYWFDEKKYLQSIENEMCQLMIGVTEKCNMRCRYCVYGGHYESERIHGESNIPETIILKAIDYFFEISKNKNKIVNFYGGEPFVNFAAIERAVHYIESVDDTVKFYITTNGTLITEKIQNWFLAHPNVDLYVSLAGIPQRHDELRVLKDGMPTFETIKRNLLQLRNRDVSAFKNRVHFIFNIFADVQLMELQEFFDCDELFDGVINIPEVSYIDCYDDDGEIKKIRDSVLRYYDHKVSPIKEYIKRLDAHDLNNIIVNHYDNIFLRIHRRSNYDANIITGVCRPFAKKMFVDIHGHVHMCENFTNGTVFGDIDQPFAKNKIEDLLKVYKEHRSSMCRQCWASKLCSLCYRDLMDRDGTVNIARAHEVCENEKAGLQKLLRQYCEILEKRPDILDHLYEYTIIN